MQEMEQKAAVTRAKKLLQDESHEQLLSLWHQIHENLGSESQSEVESIEELTHPKLYIGLFEYMYPYLEDKLEALGSEKVKSTEEGGKDTSAMQQLIDLLANDLLEIDLSHIRGAYIEKGDKLHLLHFLELLVMASWFWREQFREEKDSKKLPLEELAPVPAQKIENFKRTAHSAWKAKIDVSKLNAKEKREILRIEELANIEMGDFVVEKIRDVRADLRSMRKELYDSGSTRAMFDEQLIGRQKRAYRNYLREFLEYKQTVPAVIQAEKTAREVNLKQKHTALLQKERQIQDELENLQKSFYYQMRDQKILTMRSVHKQIFQQEKLKILDENETKKKFLAKKDELNRNAISSMENQFRDKINMLREQLQNTKREREIVGRAQIKVAAQLEHELSHQKKSQLDELRDLWRGQIERERGASNADIERKIVTLYKKHS